MTGSNKFVTVVSQLSSLIIEDDFTLPADKDGDPHQVAAADMGKGLEGIIKSLPDEKLQLTSVKTSTDSDTKWSLSGQPAAGWPVPGFSKASVDIEGSKATIKVTDKGQDKDCQFELVFTGKIQLGISCPIGLTYSENGKYQVSIPSSPKDPIVKISPIALADQIDIPGFSQALKAVSQLIHLDSAGLVSASISAALDPATQKNTVTGVTIIAGLTIGSEAVQVKIAVPPGAGGKLDGSHPTVTISWTATPKPIALSAILGAMGVPFTLPPVLDTPIQSFAVAHQYITDAKSQLNPNDTRRVVLQSPAGPSPNLLLTGSFDQTGAKRVTLRLGWGSFSMKNLPVVGSHLPGSLSPLLLLLTTRETSVKDMAALCVMKDFRGLESFGIKDDKLKAAPPFRAGIHCAGLFKAGESVNAAFRFGLYQASQKKPAALLAAPGLPAVTDHFTDPPPTELAETGDATELPVQRSVGPVSLESLTFKFEKDRVSFILNLSITAGGMSIELVGLRAGFDVATRTPVFGIDGGILSYASGNLRISGGFVRDTSGDATDWIGTALIQVGEAFALNAALAFSDGDPKKLFLFAYVRRQLGGPPWCYITGLAGGFGYNRSFIVPPVDEVNDFPLIAMANTLAREGTEGIPEKLDATALWTIVTSIQQYLPPDSTGTNFGTAGFTCTSFGFINSTVLLVIIFGSRLEFVLLGSSAVDVPKGAPVAHADLQLVASLRPDEGILSIDGVLGSDSYVLSKACRLTGGFAMHTWFSGPHAGDFVISFGGYHPAYVKPSHYPAVPRLGFLWKVSNSVRISGYNYFALTPRCVQAGGGFDLVLDADPLRAWVHAEAHFWINWLPFFYDVRAYVDFGISFRLDLFFCSVTINIDISADLRMWGPPFSGHADIHLWFVSFGVDFGAGASTRPVPAGWTDFVNAFITPTPPASRTLRMGAFADSVPANQASLDIVSVAGNTPPSSPTTISGGAFDGKPLDWFADPQLFQVTISTVIPAETARFNSSVIDPGRTDIAIYARPVADSPAIHPSLSVTLKHESGLLVHMDATVAIGMVGAAMWGPPGQPSTGAEMIPGITGLTLVPNPTTPDRSVAVDVQVLLFAASDPLPLVWETPVLPTRTFDWATSNPFQTISVPGVQQTRTTMLNDLVTLNYLSPAAASVDVSNIKPGQPCFMMNPILCRLGTAKTVA